LPSTALSFLRRMQNSSNNRVRSIRRRNSTGSAPGGTSLRHVGGAFIACSCEQFPCRGGDRLSRRQHVFFAVVGQKHIGPRQQPRLPLQGTERQFIEQA